MTQEEERRLNDKARWMFARKFHSSLGDRDVIIAANAYVQAYKKSQAEEIEKLGKKILRENIKLIEKIL